MIQYVISEEEMLSLFDQLKLAAMQDKHMIMRGDYDKPPTMEDVHRAFHMVTVRWAQAMGFRGVRS